MSDYDDLAKAVGIMVAISFITLPIWIIPYGVWWLIKHEDWEREEKEREVRDLAWHDAHPPRVIKPKLWSSMAEKARWIADHHDIE